MKEGKVFKRVLAIALVVVMAITMVPFGVFATGGTTTPAACDHSYEWVGGVQSTCTVAGVAGHYVCNKEGCGKVFKNDADKTETTIQELTRELAHTWNAGTVTTPATCANKGVKTFACTKCTATKTEDIDKLTTHTWNATTGKCSVCTADCTHSWTAGKCTVCEKVCTHTGGTPTCTTQAVCSVCGQSYGATANHSYATTFTEDNAPSCTVAGSKSKHCTTAGCTAKTDVTPIPATGHEFDKSKADGDCTKCTYVCAHDNGEVIPAVEATCTEKGSTAGFKCSDCGFVHVAPKEINALGHDIEVVPGTAPTCTATGKSDGEKCKRCDYVVAQTTIPATGHDFTATTKTVTKEPTCTEKGSKAIVCKNSGCNEIKENSVEEIPMVAHDYKTTKEVTKEAKCDVAGEKAKVCKNCTAKTDVEVIPALEHDWEETSKKAATCEEKGEINYKCKRTGCTATKKDELELVDHDYEEVKTEATCEKDGYSTFTCKVCGDEYDAKKVEKFGHSFITFVQDENTATCYRDGTKTATCDHGCGKTKTETDEGSKIDHTMTDFTEIKAPTCTEEGEEEAKCFYFEQCGYSESYATDALGHTVDANTTYTVDVPATCTAAGSESKHCERCEYTEGSREIKALGHDFVLQDGSTASCLTAGVANYKCSRCPETKKEDVGEPLGHEFKNYIFNEGTATCSEDGTETSKCSRCDVTDTRTAAGTKLAHTPGEAVVVPATTKANGSSTTACSVCGEIVDEFEIAMIKTLSLKFTVATYNGNDRLPKLTITDANGNVLVKNRDYTVVTPTKEESAKIGQHKYDVTFMGNYEGEEEVTYKVLPGKSSKVSAEKKQTEIKLTWKEVKGATGYRVYVYNSKTKKYEIVAKYVKGKTSYTVKDLKANTTYKFAIKAYGKDDEGTVIWASESLKASFKTLVTKTSKITATPAKTSIKLTWNKVSGADGYRVYVYNTKTKAYKTVATVDGKTNYTVKDLKAGTSYKFAVKAYDVVNEKKVWSNQSKTITVKTTK